MMLIVLLLAPALAAALLPALDRHWGRSAGWAVAALFTVLAVALLSVAPTVLGGQPQTFAVEWMPSLGIGFGLRLDGLALMFCLMALVVGALVKVYGTRYFPPGPQGTVYAVMALFALGMLGLALADDMLLLYLFWELTTICSFLLIGREGSKGAQPAVRTVILTAAGGMCLLMAAALIWVETGTTDLSVILDDTSWVQGGTGTAVMLLLIAAAFTKSGQFPFHFWLPDAMAASTPVSAYLHAATMVKAGVYLLLRFSPAFAEVPLWQILLIGVGLLTALYGAVIAVTRDDLKELLAYSTISQLGLIIAAIGVGSTEALVAAAAHTLAHALYKAALFMVVGIVDHQAQARTLSEVRGMGRRLPVTAGAAVLGAASLAGIPPLMGFVTKEKILGGFAHATHPMPILLATGAVLILASALTVAYAFRFIAAFFGPVRSASDDPQEATPVFLAAPALLAAAGLGLGLAVPTLNPLFAAIGEETSGTLTDPELSLWHGVTAELLMSLAVIGLGVVLTLLRRPLHALLTAHRMPVQGTVVFDSIYNGLIGLGKTVASWTSSFQPTRHVVAPLAVLTVLASAALWAPWDPAEGPGSTPREWALLVLLAVAVAGSLVARARLVVLGLIGIVGFVVALWFFDLGGTQLALAQVLVEVLTTVIAAVVLVRMPRDFTPIRRRRRVGLGAVAVAGGAMAALAAYWLTGRRDRSSTGEWFLSHSEQETGGTNVVSTILVDFRALDTLGELVVLAVAGLAVAAVASARGVPSAEASAHRIPAHEFGGEPEDLGHGADPEQVRRSWDNTLVPRVIGLVIGPVLGVLSGYLLLRGHSMTGDGFTAGLVAAMGAVMLYLSAPQAHHARLRLAYPALIVTGVVLPILAGTLGFLEGSFLRPLHTKIEAIDYTLSTVLIFEVGILLVVVGTAISALRALGMPASGSEVTDPGEQIDQIVDEQTTERSG